MIAEVLIQAVSNVVATIVGGLIAYFTSACLSHRAYIRERDETQKLRLLDAYAEWARVIEELLSHNINARETIFAHRKALNGEATTELITLGQNEVMRTSTEAGDSARRVDGCMHRVLLLEFDATRRKRVRELREMTMLKGISFEASQAEVALRNIIKMANCIHTELVKFIDEVAEQFHSYNTNDYRKSAYIVKENKCPTTSPAPTPSSTPGSPTSSPTPPPTWPDSASSRPT